LQIILLFFQETKTKCTQNKTAIIEATAKVKSRTTDGEGTIETTKRAAKHRRNWRRYNDVFWPRYM